MFLIRYTGGGKHLLTAFFVLYLTQFIASFLVTIGVISI